MIYSLYLKYSCIAFKNIQYITKQIANPQSNLICFSGGQDSTFLLLLVLFLNIAFTLMHVNHLIEITNFLYAIHTQKLIYLLEKNYHLSIPSYKLLTEQISCNWRYDQFTRSASFYAYTTIWIANTNTDYFEKIFLNLIRGCDFLSPKLLQFKTIITQNTYSHIFTSNFSIFKL